MSDEVLTDKAQILARMAESRQALVGALERAGPELIERPGSWGDWTLKDMLAHLVYWQSLAAERVQLYVDGRVAEATALSPADDTDADARNANVQRANHGRPLGAIRDALDVSYRTLLTATKSVPPALLADGSAPVGHWIAGNSYAHYEEHLADIAKAIEGQSAERQ